jgi:hypothetical protein
MLLALLGTGAVFGILLTGVLAEWGHERDRQFVLRAQETCGCVGAHKPECSMD